VCTVSAIVEPIYLSHSVVLVWLFFLGLCPNCGEPLTLGAQYCWKCGTRANGHQIPQTSPEASPSAIFTETEYVIEKKALAPTSTFEIKEGTGNLVAIAKREVVPLGSAYILETAQGVRIGELRGEVALIPNRPFLEIRDAQSRPLAIIMMRVGKKPGAGFFSIGVTTWMIAKPSGEELAEINWAKGGHEWTIKSPDGTTIGEGKWKWLEIPHDTFSVRILSPAIDPYFVLASVWANPAAISR